MVTARLAGDILPIWLLVLTWLSDFKHNKNGIHLKTENFIDRMNGQKTS